MTATRRVRFWDLAATTDGDYTVGALVSMTADRTFYVEDVVRGRWAPMDRDKVILQTAKLDGQSVHIWIEQEPGSSGKSLAAYLIKSLAGYVVYAERSTGEKTTRAQPFAAQCEARNVKIVRGPWNAAFLDELCIFPSGKHDDQVDAVAGAFNKVVLEPRPGPTAAIGTPKPAKIPGSL